MVPGEGSLSQDFGLTCTSVYLSNIFGEGSFEQTVKEFQIWYHFYSEI